MLKNSIMMMVGLRRLVRSIINKEYFRSGTNNYSVKWIVNVYWVYFELSF